MAQSKKARDLEILNYKINEYDELIQNFILYDISEIKRNKLEVLRDATVLKRDVVVARPNY